MASVHARCPSRLRVCVFIGQGVRSAHWSGHAAPPSELKPRECIPTDTLPYDIPSRSEGSAGCPPIRRLRERWEGKSEPQLGGLPRARDGADSPCPSRRHSTHLAGWALHAGTARGQTCPRSEARVGGTAAQLHRSPTPVRKGTQGTEGGASTTNQEPTHAFTSPRHRNQIMHIRQASVTDISCRGEIQASPLRVRSLKCHSENKFSPRHFCRLTPTLPPKYRESTREINQLTNRNTYSELRHQSHQPQTAR